MPMTAQAEIFIQDACLPDGRRGVGLLASGGRIQAIGPGCSRRPACRWWMRKAGS